MSNLEDLTIKCREMKYVFTLSVDTSGLVEANLIQQSAFTNEVAREVLTPSIQCRSILIALEWAINYLSRVGCYERD